MARNTKCHTKRRYCFRGALPLRTHAPFYRRCATAAKTFLLARLAERHLRVSLNACGRGLPRRRPDSRSVTQTCRDVGKGAVCGADIRWFRRRPLATGADDVSRRNRRPRHRQDVVGPLLSMSESASWARAAIPSWFADARKDLCRRRPETRTHIIIIRTSFGCVCA